MFLLFIFLCQSGILYQLIYGYGTYLLYLPVGYKTATTGYLVLVHIVLAFPLRYSIHALTVWLNMAVGASALCTYQYPTEYEPFPFVWSVFSSAPRGPYLLPSFLYPLKQFLVYDLFIILGTEIVIILQYPAYGCMGPAYPVMGIFYAPIF